ncbi:hypothetical protein EDB89DRAFT_1909180 [Lactarius sanguifluus]|nr:hypothetical protein EDB89DRAFT_1909180 [Lactarius sanguifluus]
MALLDLDDNLRDEVTHLDIDRLPVRDSVAERKNLEQQTLPQSQPDSESTIAREGRPVNRNGAWTSWDIILVNVIGEMAEMASTNGCPQWAAGPAKLTHDPANTRQVQKASKRGSPHCNTAVTVGGDGLWSSEGDSRGEGIIVPYPPSFRQQPDSDGHLSNIARLLIRGSVAEKKLEKEGCKNLQRDPKVLRSSHIRTNARSKRSSEPTHKVNQTEGSEGVEEHKQRVEEAEQANPPTESTGHLKIVERVEKKRRQREPTMHMELCK